MAYDLMDDVKPLITAAITGVTVAGELTMDTENMIAILHTGGMNPIHTFGAQKAVIIQPSFQIVIRHLSENTMHGWWDKIKIALDGKTNYTVNARTYLSIFQQGDVLDLGRDDARRHIQVLNFNAQVTDAY